MTTYSWTPGVSADWSSAVDWAPFGVPSTLADDAVIAVSGSYTVTIAAGESFGIGSLTESAGTVNVLGTLSANALTLTGGTFQVENSGTATFGSVSDNTGAFGLHNDAVVTVDGDFTNSATLDVDNAYSVNGLGAIVYEEGGGSLTIDGTLNNTGTVQVGDTARALNAATTITLGGLINASGANFRLYGSSSYTATLAFGVGGAGFTSNAGDFELTYAAPLTLGSSFINSGTFGLHLNTALTVDGDFTNSATLDVDNAYSVNGLGAIVYEEGGSSLTIDGTLNNTGTVQVGDTARALNAATTITIGGLINASGANFRLYGSSSYTATLAFGVGGAGFTSNAGDFELTYAAPLTLGSSFINSGTFGLHLNTALTVDGDFTNSATLDVDNAYSVNGLGAIVYEEGGSSLTIDGTLNNTGTVQVGDTARALNAATTITIGGLINASGANFRLYGSSSYTATLAFGVGGAGFTSNAGDFELTYAAPLTLGSSFINSGTFGLHLNTALTVDGDFTNSATLDVDNAYSVNGLGAIVYEEGGSSLTIDGTLNNTGTVQVGDTARALNAATTITLGGLINASGANFRLYGSSSYTATLAFGVGGAGFTSNAGDFELTYAAPLTLGSSFINSGTFGLHLNTALTVDGDFTNSATLDVDNAYSVNGLGAIVYEEGGSSLTIDGTLNNTGTVQVGDTARALNAATTITIGGLINASGANFRLYGSSSYTATLAFGVGGAGFTSNAGDFELTYAAPLTLGSSFINSGTFGLHLNTALTVDGDFTNSATLDVDNAYSVNGLGAIVYEEGGSSLTIDGTLNNTGTVQVGDTARALNAATTITIGGLINASGANFRLYGSSSYTATLAFGVGGAGFTSNAGDFELTYAAPLTLGSSFINSGTFGLHLNTALTVDGDFTNSATLDVDNAYSVNGLGAIVYEEGGSSLTIDGTLNNTGTVQVGDTARALNAATTITIGGLINASGANFRLYGSSSYTATLAFGVGGAGFTSNAGDFELTYAAPLTLGSSFINSGTFGLHLNTALTVDGDFTNSATLDVDNAYSVNGLGAIVYEEGGSSLTIDGTLNNTGTVQVGDTARALNAATTITLGGLINASGASFRLYGSSSYTATLTATGPASNAGILTIGSFAVLDVTGGNPFTQTGGTTTVNGTFTAATIDIDGGSLVFNTTNFTNTGTLAAADGGVINFSVGGLTNLSGTTLTGGTFVVAAGSTLQLPNNAIITALAADLTLSGVGSVVESLNTSTKVQVQLESTLGTIAVGGALHVLGGRNYTTANTITDDGFVEIGGGILQAASASVATGAALSVDIGGVLDLSSALVVNGTLTNDGTVNGGGATAATFGSGIDRLILDPGATFDGNVIGGAANTTLELAKGSGAAGTVATLGNNFTNFGTVIVDAGATWTVDAAASVLASTTLIGNGPSSTLVVTTPGTYSLAGVSNFGTIDLPAGNNNVAVTDATLSGGSVTINDGPSGNNTVSAVADTGASTGKTLIYVTGAGSDALTGGFENDTVSVSATAVGGDTLTGGSGSNTLVLINAGTINLGGVSNFSTIDLATGSNKVTVTDATLSGGTVTIIDGASGNSSVSAAGDTAKSTGKSLKYVTGPGADVFTGGFENDTVTVSATAVTGDVLTGGSGNNLLLLTSAGTFSLGGVGHFGTIDLAAGNNTVSISAAALSGEVLTGGTGTNTLMLTTAGTVNLGGVSGFATIDLAAGNSTVTLNDTTLSGGSVALHDGASGNNNVSAAGDSAKSSSKTLTYVANVGTDVFTGGSEIDVIHVSAKAVGNDTLTGGSNGANTLILTSAGTLGLGGVSRFGTIELATGNNVVTVTDTTLSGGPVVIRDGTSGNNNVSAAGDSANSAGKTLTYETGTGSDTFIGGFENDVVHVAAANVGGDVLTGGSGNNLLLLTSAGTFSLGGVSHFGTIDLAAGNNTVSVSAAAVSGEVLTGGTGTNTLMLTSAGTVNLSGVKGFATIDLAAGNSTVTLSDRTLSGGSVVLHDGASGNNSVSDAGDTLTSASKSLTYVANQGTDTFAGGFEIDVIHVSAKAVGNDTLTGGSNAANTLILLSAGTLSLGGVSRFGTIELATGNNVVTVTDTTLSGGPVVIRDGTSGNNNVSAAGDSANSAGKTLTYEAGTGNGLFSDTFIGGSENDVVHVFAADVGNDVLTGGRGNNLLLLLSAGTVNLTGVAKFATIDLAAGSNSAVTLGDMTMSGKSVVLRDGASGDNNVSAAGDTAASAGASLTYVVGTGHDTFTGGFENDAIHATAAVVGGDVLTGGSGSNTLLLTSAGTLSLGGVSRFGTIDLATGSNTVTVTDTTLSGGSVVLRDGASGNNNVSAAGDSAKSASKTLTYEAGTGNDTFIGGFENDVVHVSAQAVGGDVLTGGSGNNLLLLTTAGTVSLSGVSHFATIDLSTGNNDKVTLTDATLSGGSVVLRDGASGNNNVSAAGDTAASANKMLTYFEGAGNDVFTAGFENDTVYAGSGSGTYTAGSGHDSIVFIADNLPNQTLNKFQVATDVVEVYGIHASNGFDLGSTDNGLNPMVATAIDPTIFVANSTGDFTSASQRFAYDTVNGNLLYSASGNNASATSVATLTGAPAFTASDLLFLH